MRGGSLARLAGLTLLWGSGFFWIAIALRGFSPVQIVLIRLGLGALMLPGIARARRIPLPRGGRIWLHLTVAALFANAIPYTLFAVAEQHVTSSAAGVLTPPRRCGPWLSPWPAATNAVSPPRR